MAKVIYQRRIRSNNNQYQTEDSMVQLLSEIRPDGSDISAEHVECFDENDEPYNEEGYMSISVTIEDNDENELGIYNDLDETLESNLIYVE